MPGLAVIWKRHCLFNRTHNDKEEEELLSLTYLRHIFGTTAAAAINWNKNYSLKAFFEETSDKFVWTSREWFVKTSKTWFYKLPAAIYPIFLSEQGKTSRIFKQNLQVNRTFLILNILLSSKA